MNYQSAIKSSLNVKDYIIPNSKQSEMFTASKSRVRDAMVWPDMAT